MYNTKQFQVLNLDETFDLMERNPLATLISIVDHQPFISHLPLTPQKSQNGIELIGHLARANPHSKELAKGPVTVIFQGAHTYITPQWYAENDVPTWSYSIAHITGSVELIENYDGIISCLKDLSAHAEKYWPSGWEFFIPDDLKGLDLSKYIVGFKIKIQEVQFKRKLSQNRSAEDRVGIMRGLESRADDNSRGVLLDMLNLYSKDGELLPNEA